MSRHKRRLLLNLVYGEAWTIVYGYRNKSRTYYIIVVRSRIVARLRKEAQELVLEGLQPAGGRYEVYGS